MHVIGAYLRNAMAYVYNDYTQGLPTGFQNFVSDAGASWRVSQCAEYQANPLHFMRNSMQFVGLAISNRHQPQEILPQQLPTVEKKIYV